MGNRDYEKKRRSFFRKPGASVSEVFKAYEAIRAQGRVETEDHSEILLRILGPVQTLQAHADVR